MNTLKLKTISKIKENESSVYIFKTLKDIKKGVFSIEEQEYIKSKNKKESKRTFGFNHLSFSTYAFIIKEEKNKSKRLEDCRKEGAIIAKLLNTEKYKFVNIIDVSEQKEEVYAFIEGIILASYQFIDYKKDRKEKENSLKTILTYSKRIKPADLNELTNITAAVWKCRDFINEPVCNLNAVSFSNEIKAMFKDTKASVEIFNKLKIQSLKMGGLLAVNKGSIDPPTFTIIEWKPKNAINKKPYVFVGKGLVFDTGGLSLKPWNYMTTMKSDMSGGAGMACALYAIAKNELPIHIIGLIPSTDNRPDGNAYAPDDIIKMYDGTYVEIISTDAEGRMILADALSYAKKYNPELVIDMATLTGSAAAILGANGLIAMGDNSEKALESLKISGENVYERVAELPFWEEFGEDIKSEVADIKNSGGRDGGAITAGKFLAHFTDYPFIHLDIAGPAFIEKTDSYKGCGGTGVGVRLLYDFIKNIS